MAAMAAAPAVASAQLVINSVNLTRAEGPPGSVLIGGINGTAISHSTVTVTRTNSLLRSVRYFFNGNEAGGTCVDLVAGNFPGGSTTAQNNAFNSTTGQVAVNVNPALPRDPGSYTISYRAFAAAGCTGAQSGPFQRTGNVTVQPRATNPTKAFACGGLRVALVLDESLSIVSPGGGLPDQTGTVRGAALAFVRALANSDTDLAIIPFSVSARVPTTAQPLNGLDYEAVTDTTIANDFEPFIKNEGRFNPSSPAGGWGFNPSRPGTAGTNWDRGFRAVSQLSGDRPDLVVFVTDGDPNGTDATTSFSTTLNGGADIMAASVASAATVKQTSRIFSVGVGQAVESQAGISRLTAVSNDTEFDGTNLAQAGYTVAKEFGDLQASLTRIVTALCGGRLVVTKKVFGPEGELDASGWTFSATISAQPHEWERPSSAGKDDTAHQITNSDGIAEFEWRLIPPVKEGEKATLSVREHSRRGFRRVYSKCEVHEPEDNGEIRMRQTQRRTRGLIAVDRQVPLGGWMTCQVWNRQKAARLTVVKRLRPADDPGRFNLIVGGAPRIANVGNRGTTGQILLPLGSYPVTETGGTQADNTTTSLADYDISTRCVNRATGRTVASNSAGPSVSVRLRRESDNIVCTITNRARFGDITVIKRLVPDTAPGAFDLFIGDIRVFQGARDGDSGERRRLPFGTYTVRETGPEGAPINEDEFSIRTVCIDQSTRPATQLVDVAGPQATVTLNRTGSDIQCTITNTHVPPPELAHLTVVKRLVPSEDAAVFDLLVDGKAFAYRVGDGGRTDKLEFEAPATAKVSERGADGTDLADFLISTTCKADGGDGPTVAHGTGSGPVNVSLKANDSIVCTIRNTRKEDETVPEGGGVPPPPCLDIDDDSPVCGDLAAAPNLAIGKSMPAHARVGQAVPITITVKNVGVSTAHGVRLVENPPLGRRLLRVGNNGSIQSDGTAVWHLGSLAPGQSRTVHAIARVTRAGLHLNTAVVTASNAGPADAQATVRAAVAAHRPPPPPVTG